MVLRARITKNDKLFFWREKGIGKPTTQLIWHPTNVAN